MKTPLQSPQSLHDAETMLYLVKDTTATQFAKDNSLSPRTVQRWVEKAKRIIKNDSFGAPVGHNVTKTTVGEYVRDDSGKLKEIRWHSTNEEINKMQETVDSLIERINTEVIPVKPSKPLKKQCLKTLATTYILTDYHLGQLSWAEETGANWDTDIAFKLLDKWITQAIQMAPDSEVGILAELGDFLHWDGLVAATNASGHILDADTRFGNLTDLAADSIKLIVDKMLTKHKHVHVILAEGNHDENSTNWLQTLFRILYSKEPRVTVDQTKQPYYAYQWGETSLFFHHGHKRKPGNVSEVFAEKYRKMYGDTTYSYVHLGHFHHREVKENNMMIVEQHPTLAAKDAYSSRGGYGSKRAAHIITYSKKFGEVSRLTLRPEMIE